MATARRTGRGGRRDCKLEALGWNERTRLALETLIRRGAGKNLPVVFDFDNTIISGDIGEATLAVLVRDGKIDAARLPETLSPAFRPPGKRRVTLTNRANPTEYYEALLAPTAHGERDPAPLANGYAWAVEVMGDLRPWDVLEAARKACEFARPHGPGIIDVSPGTSRFPVPAFYPEMVALLAQLLRHKFAVWIVSASNVWSVRWMVQERLNPLLRAHGAKQGLRADHVIGVATLLRDRRDALYKDTVLVKEDARYAALDEKVLRSFRLTSHLQFPLPSYSGKVACMHDAGCARPFLAVGDSPGDHALLSVSQNRLWIVRLDKPDFQEQSAALIRKTGAAGWMVQGTLANTGFVPDLRALRPQSGRIPDDVRRAAKVVVRMDRYLARGCEAKCD